MKEKVDRSKFVGPYRIQTKLDKARVITHVVLPETLTLEDAERVYVEYIKACAYAVVTGLKELGLSDKFKAKVSLKTGSGTKTRTAYEALVHVKSTDSEVENRVFRVSNSGGWMSATNLLKDYGYNGLSSLTLDDLYVGTGVIPSDEGLMGGHYEIKIGHTKIRLKATSNYKVKMLFLDELKHAVANRKRRHSVDLSLICQWVSDTTSILMSEIVVSGNPVEGTPGFLELPWGCWSMKELLQEDSGKGAAVDEPETRKAVAEQQEESSPKAEEEGPEIYGTVTMPQATLSKNPSWGVVAEDHSDLAIGKGGSADMIVQMCDSIKAMLLEKNRKYGDSALAPKRVFSKADPVEQLRVRIDDKLSRIQSGQADEDEDVYKDLVGYLILLMIAVKDRK